MWQSWPGKRTRLQNLPWHVDKSPCPQQTFAPGGKTKATTANAAPSPLFGELHTCVLRRRDADGQTRAHQPLALPWPPRVNAQPGLSRRPEAGAVVGAGCLAWPPPSTQTSPLPAQAAGGPPPPSPGRRAVEQALPGGQSRGAGQRGEGAVWRTPSVTCIFEAANPALLSARATGLRQEDFQATPGSPQPRGQPQRNK